MSDPQTTAELLAAHRALLARVAGLEAERDHLKRRERDIIEATEPADDGQWRADIVGAIQRLRRERDAARAEALGLREQMGEARVALVSSVPVQVAVGNALAALSREPTAPCCGYHASGGHRDDRCGRDPVGVVAGAHVDVREVVRARDEQIQKALEEEAKRHEKAIEIAKQHGDDGEHHRLSAADLRAFAAKLGGPR